MAQLVNAFEAREIRGWILRALYNLLPKAGSAEIISEMLTKAGFDVSVLGVQGHFRYLADESKKYIDTEEAEVMGTVRHMAKLNSKGVDYVEGNLPEDPGISRK